MQAAHLPLIPGGEFGYDTPMTRLLLALSVLLLPLAGCAGGAGPQAIARQAQPAAALARTTALHKDVVAGMTRIFERYDDAPKDGRASYAEFGRVVTREWFDAHDPDGDGFMRLEDWMTPDEIDYQIAAIQGMATRLLGRADRNADGRLTLAELQADRDLEIDPTPWLAGPADPQVKATAFARFADAQGLLTGDAAALLIGALLAQGYYVSDPQSERRGPRVQG